MARLITKFKYLKPGDRNSVGNYAKYIATREGVEKIDDSIKLSPATESQKKLIEQLLRDFPDSKDMHEYEDYLKEPNRRNASELISRAIEDNAHEIADGKTYADYIATRPRAERFGSHGLFTDDGVQVVLSKVSEELNHHEGNVWTTIISLRREDAERLGYNKGERWRDMLRTQSEALSTALNIPLANLRWYAAFHNESHHPHVHLIAYSTEKSQGYLTKNGVHKLRAAFAKDIFAQDLLHVYQKQTEHRDTLRQESQDILAQIIRQINDGSYHNPSLTEKLSRLADKLSKTSGKKVYGYLKPDVKALVCSVVDELAADERIAGLYDLWYEQRENVLKTYTQEMPERVPLSQNDEFKSIRNAVIKEAMNIVSGEEPIEELDDNGIPDEEPSEDEIENEPIRPRSRKERNELMWNLYCQAKELLDRNGENYNPQKAVELLIDSADLGNTVAKYQLGKLFLKGEDVPKNVDYALRWLEDAVKDRNQYAEYLLGKLLLKGEDVEQDSERGEELLRRSIAQGNKYAAYALGKAKLEGTLLPQDFDEALKLLKLSADKGFSQAQYLYGKLLYKGEITDKDIQTAIEYLEKATMQKNPYAAYLAGKIRLTEESVKDIKKAIRNFEIAAECGNDYAEYQLGRIYIYGKETERDFAKAMEYLNASAEHGNKYAEELLRNIRSNHNWSAGMGVFRLFHHLARIIQDRIEEGKAKGIGAVDRKLRRQIEEKKQAQGLKHG